MSVALQRYRFTVEQYHRMGELGIIDPDCRVELINGEIFLMSLVSPWHSGVVNRLTHRLAVGLAGRVVVHVQNPVGADKRSEPQPDLMLLRPRADFYGTAHSRPEDSLLLLEVADTSLARDRRLKLPLYARVGVREVWIVNRRADAIEIFREPTPEGYRIRERRARGEGVAPAAFPDFPLTVDDILG